ncbi:MAG: SxtJ family membrane protein [Pseudomonadota bacterium]
MKKKPPSPQALRKFGLGLALILALIGGFLWWRERPSHLFFLGLAVLALVLGLSRPRLLTLVYGFMSKLGAALGWFNSRVILTLIYLLLFSPIALCLKLLGRDILDARLEPERKSYWRPVEEQEFDPQSLPRQF